MSEVGGGSLPGVRAPETPPSGTSASSLPELLLRVSGGSEEASEALRACLREGVRLLLERKGLPPRTDEILAELVHAIRRDSSEILVAPTRWIRSFVLRTAAELTRERPVPPQSDPAGDDAEAAETALQVLKAFPEAERLHLARAYNPAGGESSANGGGGAALRAEARAAFRRLSGGRSRGHSAGAT